MGCLLEPYSGRDLGGNVALRFSVDRKVETTCVRLAVGYNVTAR